MRQITNPQNQSGGRLSAVPRKLYQRINICGPVTVTIGNFSLNCLTLPAISLLIIDLQF